MNDQILRDAQYRKGLSISYFNSINSAIALINTDYVKDTDLKKFITEWRDWFLEEHKNYYASVVAKVGLYDVNESVKRLNNAKNIEELKSTWVALSEDERRDPKIIDEAKKLKSKYEKN